MININQQSAARDTGSESIEKQLVKGSAWLTFGNLFSRVLGALYIIPWTIIVGKYSTEANGLFNMGYTIYAMFLMVATAGIPTAISSLIAHYNAIHEAQISMKLLWQGLKVGLLTGLASAVILAVFAPLLAAGHASLTPVLWSLVPSVFIFPILSMFRGFFQGNQMMKESAISQIIEQVARIVYMLAGTYIVLKANSVNWHGAVIQSTFAAFIGAILGLVYLLYAFSVNRSRFMTNAKKSQHKVHANAKELVYGILKKAVPFVIVASAVTFYQLIDQYSFFLAMDRFFAFSDQQLIVQFARFNANANKLVMIIVPIAIAIAETSLPMLSNAYANHDWPSIRKQIKNIYRLFFVAMFVSAFGLYAVALPMYTVFYGTSDPNLTAGVQLLQISAIVAIFYGFFTVLSFIVQGLGNARIALRSLGYGMLLKIVFQVPMIFLLQAEGAMLSTLVGSLFSCWYLVHDISQDYQVAVSDTKNDLLKTNLTAIAVLLSAWATTQILENFVPLTRLAQIFVLLVAVIVGAFVGIVLLMKFNVANDLLRRFIPARFLKGAKND
ncbi:putative polysaccharide biosynthesis protein [Oenococcus sicerae]|uniref:putative polysaccharide biosynthesis protein n=1 Tax=Oenococcus sicerae TaxID=2203724 RepID=UPI0039EB9527